MNPNNEVAYRLVNIPFWKGVSFSVEAVFSDAFAAVRGLSLHGGILWPKAPLYAAVSTLAEPFMAVQNVDELGSRRFSLSFQIQLWDSLMSVHFVLSMPWSTAAMISYNERMAVCRAELGREIKMIHVEGGEQ